MLKYNGNSHIMIKTKRTGYKNMEDFKKTIAVNIYKLRTEAKMTQADLGAKLNYSDKAVSKWERAESLPDIAVIMRLAEIFSVTVNDIVYPYRSLPGDQTFANVKRKNRFLITLMAVMGVWFAATITFVILSIFEIPHPGYFFIYAVPASMIVVIIFNSIWGNKRRNYIYISILLWTALTALFVPIEVPRFSMIFLVGIPVQIVIILWSFIGKGRKRADTETDTSQEDQL